MFPPSLTELEALSERAVGFLTTEGQVTALWEPGRPLAISFTAIAPETRQNAQGVLSHPHGRCARVLAQGSDDAALRRAARAAGLRAAQSRAWPSAGLPQPRPSPAPPLPVDHARVTARIAIASTHGVRAAEERRHEERGQAPPREKGSGTFGVKSARHPEDVVLGPLAVAALLDRLRAAFGVDLALGHGPLAGREGARVAAEIVDLADDARDPATCPRAYDAEGLPRERVTLIENGIFVGGVHDTASAARAGGRSTGHATQAGTLAPMPDHLVLGRGDADGIEALLEGGAVYLPELTLQTPLDPLAILTGVQALTRERWTVPLRSHTPGGPGAAVVPALLALLARA